MAFRSAGVAAALVIAAAQPPDWAARIAAGQMAFTTDPAATIGAGYYPVVGNGFIGIEAGPFVLPFSIHNQTDTGSLKQSGLYSGFNYSTPSHRAQVPRVSNVILVAEPGVTYAAVGVAIDWGLGVFLNRTVVVSGTAGRCDNTLLEQRLYAHRSLRELLVLEIRASAADGSPGWAGCTLPVSWDLDIAGLGDTVLNQTLGAGPAPTLWAGTTAEPEEPGLPLRSLALAFDTWVAEGPTTLTFTPAQASCIKGPLDRRALSLAVIPTAPLSSSSLCSRRWPCALSCAATWTSAQAPRPRRSHRRRPRRGTPTPRSTPTRSSRRTRRHGRGCGRGAASSCRGTRASLRPSTRASTTYSRASARIGTGARPAPLRGMGPLHMSLFAFSTSSNPPFRRLIF